jgi:hypothetical protein
MEAAQFSGRGGAFTPRRHRSNVSSAAPNPSGSLTARGRIETAPDAKVYSSTASYVSEAHIPCLEWEATALEARLAIVDSAASPFDPRASSKHVQRLAAVLEKTLIAGSNMHSKLGTMLSRSDMHDRHVAAAARDHHATVKLQDHRDWHVSSRAKADVDNASAKIEELLHKMSSMRDQQTHLLSALKECNSIISTEMLQMQHRCQDYVARGDQAVSGRNRVESQLEEQREEILHIQKGISQPSIEDMVLISQLNTVVEKLLTSREKHSVQVETFKTSRQYLEDGRSFLHQLHVLLHDCVGNLQSTRGGLAKGPSPLNSAKQRARDLELSIGGKSVDDQGIASEDYLSGRAVQSKEAGGEVTGEVVRVAAELEDVCMQLHW